MVVMVLVVGGCVVNGGVVLVVLVVGGCIVNGGDGVSDGWLCC